MKPINSNFLSLASSSQLINNPTTNHYYDVGTTQYRHYTGLSQAVTAVAEAAVAVAAALQKSFHYHSLSSMSSSRLNSK